jgi:dTMP kinase
VSHGRSDGTPTGPDEPASDRVDPRRADRLSRALAEPPPRGDLQLSRLVDALGPGLDDAIESGRGGAPGVRDVLRVPDFRRLWMGLATSSFGDWLGLLAQTSLAVELGARSGGPAVAAYAIGGVMLVRLLPALLLGPLAGAVADRFDRRRTMIVCDILRVALFASIPLVRTIWWLNGATFLAEALALFWLPAKEASVPNLVSREQLEPANTLSLITTYGSAPVASAVFALLAVASRGLAEVSSYFRTNPVDIAFYVDAATFAVSAYTAFRLRKIGGRDRLRDKTSEDAPDPPARRKGPLKLGAQLISDTRDGWRFIGATPMVRGLTLGIVGAFAAVGGIASVGRLFVGDLGGGDAAYGVFFGAVFLGLAGGMAGGRVVLQGFSRRRLFGIAISGAGAGLIVTSLLPDLGLALFGVVLTGACSGLAWVTGYTLLGGEVEDAVRGRTFAIVQSLVRVVLFASLAVAPFIVGAIGNHDAHLGHLKLRTDGPTMVLLAGGVVSLVAGVVSYRQMDDRRGVPLHSDLVAAFRRRSPRHTPYPGLLIAVEGGEGAGKSTQVRLLAGWLADAGHEVVVTAEPGGTDLGVGIRALLLDPDGEITHRAELLLYLADRAQHVEALLLPALHRGAIVLTDRYVDSTMAYQGAGRSLEPRDVDRLTAWATAGLEADLTVLLDVRPEEGLARAKARGPVDRLEAESLAFHRRVRTGFLELARSAPWRYVVVPVEALAPDDVQSQVRAGLIRRFGEQRLREGARQKVQSS